MGFDDGLWTSTPRQAAPLRAKAATKASSHFRYDAKNLIPEPDAQQQAVFDQGHGVGALAKELYPDGVEVGENVTDLEETVRLTREALRTRKPLFEDALDDQFKVIRRPQHPDVRIGPQCRDPYPCPLQDRCWGFLPIQSVLDLYRGTKKGFSLLDLGVTLLKDIPDDTKLTTSQAIQKATAISGRPHVNHHALAGFLSGLEYPLHFLGFETFGTATSRKLDVSR